MTAPERERRGARAAAGQARLNPIMLVAAALVIPTLAIEAMVDSGPLLDVARILNWAIWVAFAAELGIMVAIDPRRWGWLRRHPLEVAIVVLTPPFAPEALQSLRVLRLLPLLRLATGMPWLRRTFSTQGLLWAAFISLVTIMAGGAIFAAVEGGEQPLDTWDGVWWAVTTVTTVGYGDYSPATGAGRVVALAVMAVGIGFVAMLTAAAAERFVSSRTRAAQEESELRSRESEALLARLDEIAGRLERLERAVERRGGDPPRG